jgi:hypothetical protein
MQLVLPSLAALFLVACTADDLDFAGTALDSGIGEPAISDGDLDKDVVGRTDAADVFVDLDDAGGGVGEDGARQDTGPRCPVHSDACPPECAPFFGYRVFRVQGCFLPLQVISCVDRAYESMPGPSCVVRIDDILFKTDEIRGGLDPAAWRQCEMSDVDFAIAWHAIPCDEDAP